MSGALKIVLLALACSALVLQPAAAYSFNFGGGKWSRLPQAFWIQPATAGAFEDVLLCEHHRLRVGPCTLGRHWRSGCNLPAACSQQ